MTDLEAFVRARIGEDEAAVRKIPSGNLVDLALNEFRERALADIEAKRALVDLHKPRREFTDEPERCSCCLTHRDYETEDALAPCLTLRIAASAYRRHPDYRADEWHLTDEPCDKPWEEDGTACVLLRAHSGNHWDRYAWFNDQGEEVQP